MVWLPNKFEWVGGSIVLTLFLSLGPSLVWTDNCGQLCDPKFRKSATPAAVQTLLEAGADVQARAERGRTPLHFMAGFSETPAVATALLAAGADIEVRAEGGRTPLHFAAESTKTPAVVETLLDAGADPTAEDAAGQTPFDLMNKNGKLKDTDVYWRLNDL